MRKLLPLLCGIAALVPLFVIRGQAPAVWSGAPVGWRPLFNGKDLDGWAVADDHGKPAYAVEDAMIRTQKGEGLLWYTREKVGNATLRVIYKMSNPEGNSGVFIRILDAPPNEAYAIQRGMKVRIDDLGDDRHVTGVVDSLSTALSRALKPGGEWNTLDIKMAGMRTIVKLNDALVTDYLGASLVESGYIALQHPDDKAVIYFREISVR